MARPEKVKIVEEIKNRLKENPHFVVTEYRGMSVEDMNRMRAKLREKGVTYQIYKNTLFRLALEGAEIKGVDEYFCGPVGVAFSDSDVVAPCKVLRDVAKSSALKVKGGYTEGLVIKEDEIEQYADMPSIEELYSKLLGTVMNPATRLVRTVNGPIQKLAIALNQISEKKQ